MITGLIENAVQMLLYILIGIFICRIKKSNVEHASSMSGLLIFVLGPMMIARSFINMEYSAEGFVKIVSFFITTLIIQAMFLIVLFLVFSKKYSDAKYRLLTCAAVMGNVGFFGIPVVSSIYPTEPIVACYCSIYVMSMNILVFTVGSFLITNDKKYISVKSIFLNPTTIALFIVIPVFLSQIAIPHAVKLSIDLLGQMATPMCLIILGMRLSSANIKLLFGRPFAYGTCVLKLLVFPAFAYMCVMFLPFFDDTFKMCIFVLSAAPSGAIIESLSELYGCEQELSATVVLMTTLMSIITVPIIYMLVV